MTWRTAPPPRGGASEGLPPLSLAPRRRRGGAARDWLGELSVWRRGALKGAGRRRAERARGNGARAAGLARAGRLHAGLCTRDRGVLGGFACFARVFRGGAAYRGAVLQAASCTWLFARPLARSERCTWGLGGGPQGLFDHGGALYAWEVANRGLRGPLHRARGCSGGLHECFCS